MALPRPSWDELKAVGESLDLALRDDDLDLLHRAVLGSMSAFDVLDALPDHLPPVRFPRGPVFRPAPDENPLNGWAMRCEVKGAAEGLLKGRTVALKDNICLAGVPMTNGSATMEGYVPDVDATVVTRVLEAGGTILGKTTNEHFCLSAGSHTHPSGPVLNPWRHDRTTGGSSSGAAAVVAAGDADMAIGGDQGGSIRVPAAFCGLVGLKPTFGLIPYTGIMAIEPSLDHTGPMTRTVADNARLLQVLAGPDDLDPRQTAGAPTGDYLAALSRGVSGLRIPLLKEGFGQPDADPQVEAKLREGAEVLARLGAEIGEVSVPGHRLGPALWLAIASGGVSEGLMSGNGVVGGRGLHVAGLHEAHAHWRERTGDLSDPVKVVMLLGRHLKRSYGGRFYAKAQNLSRKLRADYDAALESADLLLLPTTPVQAPKVLDRQPSRAAVLAGSRGNLENTSPFNVTGHPSISLPCGLIDGVPTGLMLVARHGDEATLYAAAAAFEAEVDWRGQRARRTYHQG